MALTKVEAGKLTNDLLVRGVIDTIVKESSVLAALPFLEVVGTAVTYNREATNPAATFYDVGDTWTEGTPAFTQIQTGLRIMGGDADVDNFLEQTYADPNDLQAEVITKRAKSVAHLFSEGYWSQCTPRRVPVDELRSGAAFAWSLERPAIGWAACSPVVQYLEKRGSHPPVFRQLVCNTGAYSQPIAGRS